MSRVGRLPIPVPPGVTIDVQGSHVKVTGPKGTLEQSFVPSITIKLENGEVTVERPTDRPADRALHGLVRALINNMIKGVTEGYVKVLEIQGVGYRAAMEGKNLNLQLGHSHPISVAPPAGIQFAVEGTNIIKVSGIDKQLVGQTAANVRRWRPVEPYKGKGVRYQGEYVRRKVGKAGAK